MQIRPGVYNLDHEIYSTRLRYIIYSKDNELYIISFVPNELQSRYKKELPLISISLMDCSGLNQYNVRNDNFHCHKYLYLSYDRPMIE